MQITLLNKSIRQDEQGRFSLNDLHNAAGGENKHRPSLWVENQQTKDLIHEIETEAGIPALVSIHGGSTSGTFVCKELVYAYAMWISPSFHLKVIRAFDEMVKITIRHQTLASYLPPQLSIREKRQAVTDFYDLAKDFRKDGLSLWDARLAANYAVVTATGHDELGLTTDMPFARDVAAGLSGFGDPEHAALDLMSRRTLERALARTVDTTGKKAYEVENWLCDRLDAISYSRIQMGRLIEALTLLKVYREFNKKPAGQTLLPGVAQ